MSVPWIVRPGAGVGPVSLGMTRIETRERLGRVREFPRGRGDSILVDHFVAAGVQIEYDQQGRAVFIEVAHPADPRILGVALIGRRIADVVGDLAAIGLSVRSGRDPASREIAALRCRLFVPIDLVESVSVYSDDYWA